MNLFHHAPPLPGTVEIGNLALEPAQKGAWRDKYLVSVVSGS
jgi:hypothetical protein